MVSVDTILPTAALPIVAIEPAITCDRHLAVDDVVPIAARSELIRGLLQQIPPDLRGKSHSYRGRAPA